MAHRSDGPAFSLGCLGMCTERCAVVDVHSKCRRSVLLLDTCLHTKQTRQTRRASEPGSVGGASESVRKRQEGEGGGQNKGMPIGLAEQQDAFDTLSSFNAA